MVLSPDGVLATDLFDLDGLPPDPAAGPGMGHPFHDQPTLAELERRYISFLVDRHQGHRQEIARVAGIGRSTLWRRLKEMGYDD